MTDCASIHEAPVEVASTPAMVTPERIYDKLQSYRNAAALRTAIELDLFSHIAAGATTAEGLAELLQAPVRGIRILCDFLVTDGVLIKVDGQYQLAADVAAFLDRKSFCYIGNMTRFLCSRTMIDAFENLTDSIRAGGAAARTLMPTDWVDFARTMSTMQVRPARLLAESLTLPEGPIRILDIGAGHGQFGIAIARRYHQAQVVALDWPDVVEVARENAVRAGLADRFSTLGGNALEVEFGSGYTLIVTANLIHHFGPSDAIGLFSKAFKALKKNGTLIVTGFVPDEDGVSPLAAARFNLSVLASSKDGEAYKYEQLREMAVQAGFSRITTRPIPDAMQTMVVAERD